MSRNNPGSAAGGPPQRAPAPELDPQSGWPTAQPGQGWQQPLPQGQGQGQGQGYAQPQPVSYQPQPPQAADPYAASGYHYPQGQPQAEAYAPQPPMRPGYAPQFERFAPPPPQAAPAQRQPAPRAPEPPRAYQPDPQAGYPQQSYPPESAYAPPPQQTDQSTGPPTGGRPARPHGAARAPAPAPDLRGTINDQWQTPQPSRAAPSQLPPNGDPRAYDLGAYGGPQGQGGRNDWQQQAQPSYQPQPRAAAQPALDPGRYPNPQMAAPADQSRAVVAEQDYAHDEAEYEDEPPRRSRGLLIVGALVGAIALGGGLAYAYKSFLAPSPAGKATPRVAADKSPARTQPADTGGKQFANPGVKVMGGRLTEGGDAPANGQTASKASVGDDGVRRVPTVAIRPDGSMAAPTPQAPPGVLPPATGAPPGVYVVQDPLRRVPPGIQGAGAQGLPPPQAAPAVPPPRTVAEPRTITLPPPREEAPPAAAPAPRAPPRVAVAPPPPPAAPAPQAEAAPAPRKPLPRPAAAPAAAGGSGYVAVLASQRSQMDALRTFADLQQKYGVLQGKTPDVREANLGEKGVYHRLMVGPPGSREQASALCAELKAAGYTGCWVTAQ